MPDRNFEIRCKDCKQTLGFAVRRNNVDNVTTTDAFSALSHPGRTDPNSGAVLLSGSTVKNLCPSKTDYGHNLEFSSLKAL